MKKWVVLLSSACFMMGIHGSAFANTPNADTVNPKPRKPCQNIRAACQTAGFVKGDKQGKGIWRNCIKPILAGKTVKGVTPNAADVTACQAKKAQRDAKKKAAKAANPAANNG